MNGVTFRLLAQGPGLALEADGRGVTAGPPKEQCLLAVLLMSSNQSVSIDDIIDRVWGERPPREISSTITSYIANIRGRLREAVGDRVRILRKQGTYTILLDSDSIDVHRFHRLRKEAIGAVQRGDLERGVQLYRAAEDLCRGDPLSGLPGEWARRMGHTIAETLREVRRTRIGLELRLGRHAEVLDELRDLVAQNREDEVLIAHLMTALAQSGRRTDALNVYRQAREHITETLGLEPGRQLSDLHQRILLERDVPAVAGGPHKGAHRPNTLLADVPHFVGREHELEMVAAVRADRRGSGVVVIEGMPGIGKTALALRAAHQLAARHPDATLYLNLRAHHPEQPPLDTRAALFELLRMFGVSASRIPATLDERSAMWQATMADRRAVVILDDVDELERLRPLLPRTPDAWPGLVLITSRRRVNLIEGMRRIRLGALAPEEAAELCSRHAGGVVEPAALSRTLRLCAGLPLALTQLARRMREATGSDLIRRLPGVREAIQVSYRRLPLDQQLAFRRLGLNPSRDMTMEVVCALTDSTAGAVAPVVDALLRCHLIEEGAIGRYGFHRLVRGVAYDLARSVDPERDIRGAVRRLLRHYLRAADIADRALFQHRWKTFTVPGNDERELPSTSAAHEWFSAEWRNVLELARYAAEHEWKAQCAQLMHLMAEFLDFEGLLDEAAEGHALAVRACRDAGDDLGMARAALDLAFVRFRTGCFEESGFQAKEALKIYEVRGHSLERAKCLEQLGLACWGKDERREALALWEEAADTYREINDRKGTADILRHTAMAKWSLGRYGDSTLCADHALEIYRDIGDRLGEVKTLNNKGHVAQSLARHRDADQLYRQALAIYRDTTGRENHAILDHNQGDLHQYKGQHEIALRCYAKALVVYQDAGDRRNEADLLNSIAGAYLGMDRLTAALDHFQEAKDLADKIGYRSQEARALEGIATVQREMGRYSLALAIYDQALNVAKAIDDPRQQAAILDGRALTQHQRGHRDWARILWRQASGLYDDIGLHGAADDVKLKLQTLGGATTDLE